MSADAKLVVEVSGNITDLQAKMLEGGKSVDNFTKKTNDQLYSIESLRKASLQSYTASNKVVQVNEALAESAAAAAKAQRTLAQQTQQGSFSIADLGKSATKGLTAVRQLAYILPGIGVAGLFDLAFKGAEKVIEALDGYQEALVDVHLKYKLLNDAVKDGDKEAGKQISNLQILYKAATDVTNSTELRTKAARELKAEYPEEFKNVSLLAIKNGELGDSYNKLTADIIANARAKAINDKLGEITSKQLDSDIQKRKILNAESNELARVTGPVTKLVSVAGATIGTTSNSETLSANEQKNIIAQRANAALQKQAIYDIELQNQKDFLTGFTTQQAQIDAIVPKTPKVKDTAAADKLKADEAINNAGHYFSDIAQEREDRILLSQRHVDIKKLVEDVKEFNDAKIKGVDVPIISQFDLEQAQKLIDLQNSILDNLQKDFEGFFNNIFEQGSLSFKKLGQSIIAEFTRVLASVAAKKLIGFVAGLLVPDGVGQAGILSTFTHLLGFANGTNNAPGGIALVGERGPELVNLPRGSSVTPSGQFGSGSVQVFIANSYVRGTNIETVYNRATNQSFRTTK